MLLCKVLLFIAFVGFVVGYRTDRRAFHRNWYAGHGKPPRPAMYNVVMFSSVCVFISSLIIIGNIHQSADNIENSKADKHKPPEWIIEQAEIEVLKRANLKEK